MTRLWFALIAALSLAAPVGAQAPRTVQGGMTLQQVLDTFGDPAAVRRTGDWEYLFYTNGCPVRCGSDDVVMLQEGRVITAILHSPGRRFEGTAAARALRATAELPPPPAGRERASGASRRGAPATRRTAAAASRRTRPTNLGVIRGMRFEVDARANPAGAADSTQVAVRPGARATLDTLNPGAPAPTVRVGRDPNVAQQGAPTISSANAGNRNPGTQPTGQAQQPAPPANNPWARTRETGTRDIRPNRPPRNP